MCLRPRLGPAFVESVQRQSLIAVRVLFENTILLAVIRKLKRGRPRRYRSGEIKLGVRDRSSRSGGLPPITIVSVTSERARDWLVRPSD